MAGSSAGLHVACGHAFHRRGQGRQVVDVLGEGHDRRRQTLGLFPGRLGRLVEQVLDLEVDEQPLVHPGGDRHAVLDEDGGRRLHKGDGLGRKLASHMNISRLRPSGGRASPSRRGRIWNFRKDTEASGAGENPDLNAVAVSRRTRRLYRGARLCHSVPP
jgi:hypothetical protein